MRNFGESILIFLLFFMATVAILEVDQHCRSVTSYGGDITASAEMISFD